MPSSTTFNTQLRIRRDAEERNAVHQDLGSWMEEIKAKRPVAEKKENSGNRKNRSESTQTQAISSSCEYERLQGNRYFTEGKFEEAVRCYTRCLGKTDALLTPVVFSNRGKQLMENMQKCGDFASPVSSRICHSLSAMAYLKLKSWTLAEEDATAALKIDPLHFKSYQRRCKARLALGKVRAAMADACAAVDSCVLSMESKRDENFEAGSRVSLAEVQKLRARVEKALVDAAQRAPRRKLAVCASQ